MSISTIVDPCPPVKTTFRLLLLLLPAFASQAAETTPAAASGTEAPPGYTVEPAPAWVLPAVRGGTTPDAPMYYRLVDDQLRVGKAQLERYVHVLRVVHDAAGLSAAAQIQIQFEPDFQHLVLHRIDIIRKGQRYNRIDRKRIQLLQRETRLEQRMYDGRITASIVVDDVRVGDELEYDYSLRGDNPVFEGRLLDVSYAGSPYGPVMALRYRVLAPAERKITFRSAAGMSRSDQEQAGLRDTQFTQNDVPQLQLDGGAAADQLFKHQIWSSEFADWREVAAWGRAQFAEPKASGNALDTLAQSFRRGNATPEAQLLAALRFVQQDIRYFGTEVGTGTHRPSAPEKVLAQRFGDCKDKVALLLALARRLDLNATPLLVSQSLHRHVSELPPSPLAFDHVIARVEVQGKSYYLDGTRNYQTGGLDSRQALSFERGLLLNADSQDLLLLPTAADQNGIAVSDRFHVQRFADGAQLESRIRYRGDGAEAVRAAMASTGGERVEQALNQSYVRIYPSLKSSAPLRIEESPSDNELTVVQQFVIPEFWSFPDQKLLRADFSYWMLADLLRLTGTQSRKDSYYLGVPGSYEQRISIDFAEDAFAKPHSERFDDGDSHIALHTELNSSARHAEFVGQLRFLRDEVQPGEWNAYAAKLSKLWPQLGWSSNVSAIPLEQLPKLMTELQNAARDLDRGTPKLSTKLQREAYIETLVLSWKIKGGRLSPAQLAQALHTRGVDYDNIGRYQDAAEDFKAALKLTPNAPDILESSAVNATALGELPRAVVFSSRAINASPGNLGALSTRAQALYLMRDYPAAQADLRDLLKDSAQQRRGYPLILLALAARNAGDDPQKAMQPYLNGELPNDWPRPLIDYLRGASDEDSVLRAAGQGEQGQEQLCEAYFYLGERYLAEGKTERARDYLRKSQSQGVMEYFEHIASGQELRRIGM